MSEWKMVPWVPTDEMVQAALRKFQADTGYVWDTEAAPVWMLDAIKAAFAAAPPGPVTTFKVDGPGTVTVSATGVRFESPAPSAEPTVPAASVNWLLEQCDEYQRRAHDAERQVLALRAQIEQIGGGR
jgi:hypothetical protein